MQPQARQAIQLAYKQAEKAFVKMESIICLATDGDFNVGITDFRYFKRHFFNDTGLWGKNFSPDAGIVITTIIQCNKNKAKSGATCGFRQHWQQLLRDDSGGV